MTYNPVLRPTLGITAAAMGLLLVWGTDLPKDFGAHPWWSADVVWMGGVAGVVAGVVAHRTPRAGLIGFALLTVAAFLTARWGGLEFAASFAENQIAAVAWYWGWIATFAGFAGALTVGPAFLRYPQPA